MIRLVAACGTGLLLSGCIVYASSGGETTTVRTGSGSSVQVETRELEGVHGARFERERAVVRVTSNGCTQTEHFRVEIVDGAEGAGEIALVRETPDHCRALVADGVEVSWTYDELGLSRGAALVLANPLIVP